MRLRRRLSSCLHVFAGFLTEDSYDFANSWAVKGADQSCHRVSSPSLSCNSSKDTSLVSETSMTHFVFDIGLPPRVCVCCDVSDHVFSRFNEILFHQNILRSQSYTFKLTTHRSEMKCF